MENEFMKEALLEAQKAFDLGEVPVGAVVVKGNEIVGRGHNARETEHDATAHGEMIAMREASKKLGGWRLHQCVMYVTVEPCPMCKAAMMLARLKKVYIGTSNEKNPWNHKVEEEYGVMEEESKEMMQTFFKQLRGKKEGKKK